jgi:iron complex transport system permease protein
LTRNSWISIFALFFLSLIVGGSDVGFDEVRTWLTSTLTDESTLFILSDLRLSRTLACMTVGASLGLAGSLLQTLLRNPLAEPYTLGLSGGATLGAVIAILLRWQPAWLIIPLASVLGCLIVTAFILKIAWRNTFYSQRTLILCGVMTSLFCGSVVVLLMTLFDPYQMQASFFWMLGQVGSDRDRWWPFLLALLSLSLLWGLKNSSQLDRLLLGEDIAISLGANLFKIRIIMVLIASLLCSASVSISGLVGFVGLLAPHLAAIIGRRTHFWHLPLSALMGASFLTAADILGRFIGHEREIPAGGVVALFFAPHFIFILF